MEAALKAKLLKIIFPLAALALLIAAYLVYSRPARMGKLSEFGKYQGYSEAVYDGSNRTSEYLTLSDGTQVAYDVIIPTRKGVPAGTPLPTLFKYTPYGRTWTIFDKHGNFLIGPFMDVPTQIMARVRLWIMGEKGRIMDPLWRDKWLENVVKHGYVVVSFDRPGTGASFALHTPGSMETAAKYENEIIDWIAEQPWSDGSVAMYGELSTSHGPVRRCQHRQSPPQGDPAGCQRYCHLSVIGMARRRIQPGLCGSVQPGSLARQDGHSGRQRSGRRAAGPGTCGTPEQ